MEDRPVRKKNRLESFDYASPAYYFVTVCTQDRKQLLGSVTKANEANSAEVFLTYIGKETENAILAISKAYPGVSVEKIRDHAEPFSRDPFLFRGQCAIAGSVPRHTADETTRFKKSGVFRLAIPLLRSRDPRRG